MIYSEFEMGYRKACRDLEGWINLPSGQFGRKGILDKVNKIIHAFGDDPDTAAKFGCDTEAYNIGGVTTINERAIAKYKAAEDGGIKMAFAEIEKKRRKV